MLVVADIPENKPWVKLGNSLRDSEWYGIANLSKDEIALLKRGKQVSVTHKLSNGHKMLDSVKEEKELKEEVKSKVVDIARAIEKEVHTNENTTSVLDSDKIATAITLISLSGMFDLNDIGEVAGSIYNTFKNLK